MSINRGQDRHRLACCLFNVPVDLRTACKVANGTWTGSAATCHSFDQASRLAGMFRFVLPPLPTDLAVNFKYADSHTIVAETPQQKGETVKGWGIGWRKLPVVSFEVEPTQCEESELDRLVRYVVTPEREAVGFLTKTDDGDFLATPASIAEDRLGHCLQLSISAVSDAMGTIVGKPYTLVNDPFQPEFLPGRKWNKFGTQLAVAPTYGGNHPHYDRILRHIGAGLDDAVRNDPWCQEHGITQGWQYLQVWCALLFREPKQHLPMLYLFSQARDNGKSVLHKGLGLMLKAGYVEGDKALNQKYNKLLAGAVLVYLDEERSAYEAGEKVKKIHRSRQHHSRLMRTDGFMYPNFS